MSAIQGYALGTEHSVRVKIIDLTIPLGERMKEENIVFGKSLRWTCDYLGLHKNTIHRNLGKKVYSEKHNKWFALRIEK